MNTQALFDALKVDMWFAEIAVADGIGGGGKPRGAKGSGPPTVGGAL